MKLFLMWETKSLHQPMHGEIANSALGGNDRFLPSGARDGTARCWLLRAPCRAVLAVRQPCRTRPVCAGHAAVCPGRAGRAAIHPGHAAICPSHAAYGNCAAVLVLRKKRMSWERGREKEATFITRRHYIVWGSFNECFFFVNVASIKTIVWTIGTDLA